jgi:long-chain fatty acid transport protein
MESQQASISMTYRMAAFSVLCAGALTAGPALAGGLIGYELGTADSGLASAGYGARAQDASTVFTNPAGMTRLDGTQFLAGGQVLWSNTKFSIGPGTSPALGVDDGDYAVGSNGWFPGGSAYLSYSVSPDLKAGFAVAGNFGAALEYDDNWVGRYYVQEATLIGASFLPSIAYKVNDKLSLGLGVNAMYGYFKQKVAINNIDPTYSDGELKLDDNTWGWGANLGLLYEITPETRIGFTWNSQVDLDFEGPAKFSGLAPGISTALNNAGLLNANIKVGIKVPQQVMGSLFSQVNDRWAVLGSVGWQEWSKFGQIQLGVEDSSNPTSTTTNIPFDDTWHIALGGQYQLSEPWLLNFGVAYDSGFQSGNVSLLLPTDSAWRFGVGGEQKLTKTSFWGVTAEYIYGGTLDSNVQSAVPVAVGGRGDIVGSFDNIGTVVAGVYGTWKF